MRSDKEQGLKETLSALMDGEINELELRRLLKQLPECADKTQLLNTWQRFHVARSALHGEPVTVPNNAASSRILAAIDAEPAYTETPVTLVAKAPVLFTGFAKVAVAASVTLAVFIGMQSMLTTDSGTSLNGSMAGTGDSSVNGQFATVVDAEAQRRLNDYIRTVSIQYQNEIAVPHSNVFEEIPLMRPVNQIELDTDAPDNRR